MAEPVTLAEIKSQIGLIDDTSRDDLLTGYIVAAREYVENNTGHILVSRAFTEYRDFFGGYLELTRRPITAVATPIVYTDSNGSAANYTGFISRLTYPPARIYPALNGSFPALGTNGTIAVTYTAGYASASAVPGPLKQVVLLLAAHWFNVREAVNVGNIATELPFTVTDLCDQYRALSL